MNILKKHKPTVSALILNKRGDILLTHNKNHGPDFWKLPQGGVGLGESSEEAIKREIKEELSSSSFIILKQSHVKYKYNWPIDIQKKKGFVGPKITFFILRCKNVSSLKPNLEIDELDGIKWVDIDALCSHFATLPEFVDTVKKLVSEAKNFI